MSIISSVNKLIDKIDKSINSRKFTAPFPNVPADKVHPGIRENIFGKRCGLSAGVKGYLALL